MAAPSWSWPNLDRGGRFNAEEDFHPADEAEEAEEEHVEPDSSPQPQRHYPSRTCRICFDEVLPTFDIPTSAIPSRLRPKPKVRYVSDDPTAGRLIRPCRCRGTQQYVHEGCLNLWRHSNNLEARTFYECPTCKYKYNLERMKWSRYLSNTFLQIGITIGIMLTTIFVFGFVADPIISLWLDPIDTITSLPSGGMDGLLDYEDASWAVHFVKGLASLGLLGFAQVFFAMSPWHWWNIRTGIGAGRRARRGGAGRERLEDISWAIVIIGIITFLATVWSWVRTWTAKILETAEERVLDVQGDEDEEEIEEPIEPKQETPVEPKEETSSAADNIPATEPESRKTQ